jgi:hypothetical protein
VAARLCDPRRGGGLVEEGHRFTASDVTDEILDGYTLLFDAVGDERRRELLTSAD